MSVTMVALSWSPESEAELLANGFEKREVYVRYTGHFPISSRKESAEREMFSLRPSTPYQFAVAVCWENGEKDQIVQVALCLRPGTEKLLESKGFEKITVLAKCGAAGPTAEAIPKDEQEFLSMKHPPTRWYADSYWGAGLGEFGD